MTQIIAQCSPLIIRHGLYTTPQNVLKMFGTSRAFCRPLDEQSLGRYQGTAKLYEIPCLLTQGEQRTFLLLLLLRGLRIESRASGRQQDLTLKLKVVYTIILTLQRQSGITESSGQAQIHSKFQTWQGQYIVRSCQRKKGRERGREGRRAARERKIKKRNGRWKLGIILATCQSVGSRPEMTRLYLPTYSFPLVEKCLAFFEVTMLFSA